MSSVKWKSETGTGLERLVVVATETRVTAEGLVIGVRNGEDYGVRYWIECDADWVTRQVRLEVQSGSALTLTSDGKGRWRDDLGVHRPALDGCVDVDISATPFTNTLPIRRLKLAQGERRLISVVYIPVPALEPSLVEQAYSCVEDGKRYKYEGIFRGFEAELCVDREGLVIDYPSLFARA